MLNLKTVLHRYVVVTIGVIVIAGMPYAGEHPAEHPAKKGSEHPTGGKISITKEDLAIAITQYVKKETKLKGGYFLVFDKKAKASLALTLDKVHKEKLSRVGPDLYFACADFKTPKGKVYDLDIFMKGTNKEHLMVTEISVHKEKGKARYTWYEKDGIWNKKPVK